jgi:hypothetical protein
MSDKEQLLELMNTGKIDSRMKGYHGLNTHPTLNAERTYCVVCGKPKGWVSKESYEFIQINNVVIICDDCTIQLGALPLEIAPIDEIA